MMSKKILSIVLVAILLLVGGLYIYYTQSLSSPIQNTQAPIDNSLQNNNVKKALAVIPAESKATYEIDEKLQGAQTRVVGTTQSITGTIKVDMTAVNKIEIGEIKIDATTFKTDIAKRDENVVELILKSNLPVNQYITFTPTEISSVPSVIEVGKEFPVTITGNMTILGITKPVTFNGAVSMLANNSLVIDANTKVNYGDFGLVIPNFAFLSDVSKEAALSVHLVAR